MRTGARSSPCLTPEVDVKKALAFSMPSFIVMSVYIFLITRIVFSGSLNFFRIFQSISLKTVCKLNSPLLLTLL